MPPAQCIVSAAQTPEISPANSPHPAYHQAHRKSLWRGSLLPLGREAAPNFGPAAQSSGSGLPRHSVI